MTMTAMKKVIGANIPGFYLTGDGGYRDEDGYVFVMGRTDDVMNVAGHRLSTGQIEEVVADHPAVAECAGNWYCRSGERPSANGSFAA